jgi:asparagine synthase (glutamine-hydrolysing)
MCGIAGIIGGQLGIEMRRTLLQRMCDAMAHRGPDDWGTYVDDSCALGMRRLSIIDIAGGHQPMQSADGRRQIVFNGEIYNFRDLRAQLERRGERFVTTSDTEVLLRQLDVHGTHGIHALNGMFAFAIWDAQARRLLMGRDRLGVKPLYYYWDGTLFLFASELKALIASGLVPRRIEAAAVWDYLTFRYIPPPHTIWKDVFKLPPAHLLTIAAGSREINTTRFWDIPYAPTRASRADDRLIDAEFAALFEHTVRLRLIADVPVGILLSGGLDSSAVAVAARDCGAKLETFSVGFRDAPHVNELPYARQVADYLGNPHHEIVIDEKDYIGFLPELVRYIDEPLADPASVPLYYVCRLASERVKVVLSGEGSDEILGGYEFDLWVEEWERQRRQMTPPRKGLSRLLIPLFGSNNFWPAIDLRESRPPPNMTNYMNSAEKRHLMRMEQDLDDSMSIIAGDLARLGAQPPLHQLLYTFSQSWLAEDLLMKADKMSMANSLELRTPFLDYRLVEWAARTPPEVKIGRNDQGKLVTKRVLRRFARDRLPASIIERPKKGFPVPLYDWIPRRLRGWSEDLLFGPGATLAQRFDKVELRRLFELGSSEGSAILDRHRLWNLLVLELWFREWRPQ